MAGKKFYWRTLRDSSQIKAGWKIPPYRQPNKKLALVEDIFEEVRRKEFPDRPSRIGAVFVCPDLNSEFCRDPDATVFEVEARGKTFETNSDFFSSAAGYAVNVYYGMGDREEDLEKIRERARGYWQGHSWSDEVIIQGTVTIVGPVGGRRSAAFKFPSPGDYLSSFIKPDQWAQALEAVTGGRWRPNPIRYNDQKGYVTFTLNAVGEPWAMTLIVRGYSDDRSLLHHMVLNWKMPSGEDRFATYQPLSSSESPARMIKNTRAPLLKDLFDPKAAIKRWQGELEDELFEGRRSHTMLRDDLIRLAHDNPHLRPHLLPIIKEAQQDSGGGKGRNIPRKEESLFLQFHGEKEVRNPNYDKNNPRTRPKIKLKSLRSMKGPNAERAKQMYFKEFDKFLKGYEKRQVEKKFDKGKSPAKEKVSPPSEPKEKKMKRRKEPTKKELEFGGIGKLKLPKKKKVAALSMLNQMDRRIAVLQQRFEEARK